MALPFSKSQIEKLGERLVADKRPGTADLAQLRELLTAYADVLAGAVDRVREATGSDPSSRVKTTGTILEKLHRYGGSWLKSIQDLAGMRIVGDFDRNGQDEVVGQVVAAFAGELRPPKVVDRRADPSYGYRAVHVIVFPGGVPVEIQVRTPWQHEWAELFEKLGDKIGRDIRYGNPPAHRLSTAERNALTSDERELYEAAYAFRRATMRLALSLAEVIAAVEEAEIAVPDADELEEYRREVAEGLDHVRKSLDDLERVPL